MSRWNLTWLLLIPGLIVLALTLAYAAPSPDREQDYRLVRLVVEVLSVVEHNYVQELEPAQRQKLVEDMINGGLERLDPHSAFFNAHDLQQFDQTTEGNFGGVGIQLVIDRASGVLQVASPMVGTPAYEAGVLAGDLILKVDGKSTEGWRVNDAGKHIQGKPGTEVTLTVLHEGANEPVDLTMKRALIEVETLMGDQRSPTNPKQWDYFIDPAAKIAFIRLLTFNERSTKELRKAVEDVDKAGAKAIILDLRDNPGGLLKAAVEIADTFLNDGQIVSIRTRKGISDIYEARPNDTLFEPAKSKPLVVLVNKNSASASEIVAAALQDHQRAVVIGERSYGKGSVQNIIRVPKDQPSSALKLTTASYWRPNGRNIHRLVDAKDTDEWGVTPNDGFLITLKDEERLQYLIDRRQRDNVQGKGVAPKPVVNKDGKPFVDRVLQKALEHLRAEVSK
jgi:carboxyl-terminal processing protease